MTQLTETTIETNGTRLNVAVTGKGPELLLLHGFPHTWRVWEPVIPALSRSHRVIAPDLRGLGGSAHERSGYDARNIAIDLIGVLDELGARTATVVALDAGVPPAFILGLEHPDRVTQLVLMEGTIGRLPGAENFFRAGAPWWFGFHAVPGLAEDVIAGHEREYIDFFLRSGVSDLGRIPDDVHEAFIRAYTGTEALRSAFEHYRAMPLNAEQIADGVSHSRLVVPTVAIGGRAVGEATAGQLAPITDDLTAYLLPEAGHIIPLDAPDDLIAILLAKSLTSPSS
jgi:pimeloyl-ACP methyl ester carboxylesterase